MRENQSALSDEVWDRIPAATKFVATRPNLPARVIVSTEVNLPGTLQRRHIRECIPPVPPEHFSDGEGQNR